MADATTAAADTTATKQLTRGQQVNADITALLRAKNTLLWVVTREETRVERALTEAAARARFKTRLWDCAAGITEVDGGAITRNGDPGEALRNIEEAKGRYVYVMRDLHKWINDPVVLRQVRNLAKLLQSAGREDARAIIVLSPSAEVPEELSGHTTVVDYPIPDRAEIAAILDICINGLPDADMRAQAAPNGTREKAIDAAVGLTAEEAYNCYSRSLVTERKVNPTVVANEKKRIISREKVLTWYDPDPRGLDGIGGLDVMKQWLTTRKKAFGPKARAFGLPSPKGMLLVGVPGGGKSLTAKCVATVFQQPLLRLDMGALKSKYVGESEANIRKALQVAETVSPCVLWLDEVEKAMAGSSGEQGDGGVSADALGTILSWMQERGGQVFVVATANDVRSLPPEFLRKGRFDEVFWVDLPTSAERQAIAKVAMTARNRSADGIDLEAVAKATEGFTGAEIDAMVPDALFASFDDGERGLTTNDLVEAAKTVTPLSKTAAERLGALRKWAAGRARAASLPEVTQGSDGRKLDVDSADEVDLT